MPPPEPGGPGVFSMASGERTQALLEGAGFTAVRTEEVPVRLAFSDLDEYKRWATEVRGVGLVLRGLSEREREALTSRLADAFGPFVVDGGYELPGVALSALASRATRAAV
jgi:hypothetical protein